MLCSGTSVEEEIGKSSRGGWFLPDGGGEGVLRGSGRGSSSGGGGINNSLQVVCDARDRKNKKHISVTFHFYGRLRGSLGMNKQEIIDLNLTDWVGIL